MISPASLPPRAPGGTRDSRKHTPKADLTGLYQRAIQSAFIKLDPRITVKNPVMFIVWVGTIVTFLVTLDPNLFGNVQSEVAQQRSLNGLITAILFFTLVFANFAEAVAEGRGKAQADSLQIDAFRYCSPARAARWQLPNRQFHGPAAGRFG